jgi:predicted ATPase/DNA-binding SARP family transcriptional activator
MSFVMRPSLCAATHGSLGVPRTTYPQPMRFGVLGPLAVWTADGTPVRVPELKVRALLADLLAHEGRPVPADRLADDLWGDDPPGNPTNTLQTKVSQLRRSLEEAAPGGRALVGYQPPGYRLRIPDDAVDANRFRALVVQAAAASDPREKAGLLGEALGLWRGPALADFRDDAFAQPFAARLDEERLVAFEELAEARLALGEHSTLAAELADLVARHPLRERLRAFHIRALYAAGRQDEALDSYHDLRRRLADELGVDPSPELAAVQQAVLEQAPTLAAPPARLRTNLPVPATDVVGRAEAVAELRGLLGRSRLVTLTGSGGVGKTRLALEVARGADPVAHPDGAWLVALTAAEPGASAAAVAELVLRVLEVSTRDRAAPVDLLTAALRPRRMLLVLDNCEHVVDAAAEVVARTLATAPDVRVLVTSQEALGIAGEHVSVVPSLAEEDAVALFLARAEAAGSRDPLDTGVVAEICRRLDGIPLALELAASRVRALGVHELAARLDDRFRLLAAGQRDAPARQRTLRATIDWSWQLLPDRERAVHRRLAVHVEGCTLAAAEAVCAGDGVDAVDVVDVLGRLVDRSLVTTTSTPAGTRYGLLESIAAYGLERLAEAGEEVATRRRHAAHHLALAERSQTGLRGPDQQIWLGRLDADAANLQSAFEFALTDDVTTAFRLVNALAWSWVLRGRLREAVRSLDAVLATPVGSADERAAAETWRAGIRLLAGERVDVSGLPPTSPARARLFVGFAGTDLLDPDVSERLVADTLTELRMAGDTWGVAAALSAQAKQAHAHGDLVRMEAAAEESHRLFVELGDRWGRLQASEWLAALAEIRGELGTAARLHEDGVRIASEIGLWPQAADRYSWLGRLAMLRGDHDAARRLLERGLRLATEQGYGPGRGFAILGLALLARRAGDLDEADCRLRTFTDTLESLHPTPRAIVLTELGFLAEQRGDAASAAARHREAFAIASSVADVRAQAGALEGLAGAAGLAGRVAEAATLLGAAAAAREAVGAPRPPAERADADRAEAAARADLSDTAYRERYEHGRTLRPEQAVRIAAGDLSRPVPGPARA